MADLTAISAEPVREMLKVRSISLVSFFLGIGPFALAIGAVIVWSIISLMGSSLDAAGIPARFILLILAFGIFIVELFPTFSFIACAILGILGLAFGIKALKIARANNLKRSLIVWAIVIGCVDVLLPLMIILIAHGIPRFSSGYIGIG